MATRGALRFDVCRPVRYGAMVVFAFEIAGLGESLAAERLGRAPRFPTISGCCWRHPRMIPLVMTAMALHLIVKPNKGAQWLA